MSIRINGDKKGLQRSTNLPTNFQAFTAVMCVKMAAARPTHNAHLLYMQGGAHAEGLQLRGALGTDLVATDSYESAFSAPVATLGVGAPAGQGWNGVAIRGSVTASAVRVLPIGDSLTAGSGDNTFVSYRGALQARMTAADQPYDFIGPRTVGTAGPGATDLNHAGYSGYSIAGIRAILTTEILVAGVDPDVIVVHIGWNGLNAGSPNELESLYNEIRAARPSAKVALCTLTPSSDNAPGALWSAVNTRVRALAAANPTTTIVPELATIPFTFLEAPAAGADFTDYLHWTQSGADKVAERIYSTLNTAGWLTGGGGPGAPVLRAYHKPIGGAGTLASQSVANSPAASSWATLIVGDAAFNAGDFGVAAWWPDVYIAHLKIFNRALSPAEIEAEMGQGAPVSTTGLISYHSFSSANIATAVVPDQGAGTFTYWNSAPDTSTDMPVFTAAPTLTITDSLPSSAAADPVRPGAPSLLTATVNGARSIACTFAASTGTVLGYRLYAQRSGQAPFVAATAASGATSATATGLNPNVPYTLWVVGFNDAGESLPSNTLARTTLRVRIRASKLEQTIAGVTGLRMIAWLTPAAGSDALGVKVGEFRDLVASAATFDAAEGANVATVSADASSLLTEGSAALPPAVTLLAAGTPVRVQISKDGANRSTRIMDATVVEEA